MSAALALLLALSASAAETPDAAVARVMTRVDALVTDRTGKHAGELAAADRRAEELAKTLLSLKWRAALPLGAAVRAPGRTPRARLIAVGALGLLRDPAAAAPLEDVLLDGALDAPTRALAAQSLPAQRSPVAARRALCAVLAVEELNAEIVDEALAAVSRLGCPDPAVLRRAARAFGPRPEGRALLATRHALAALGRTPGADAAAELLDLAAYYPAPGAVGAAAVVALAGRAADLETISSARTELVVLLRRHGETPEAAVVLVRLLGDARLAEPAALARLADHPDAEVLIEAAEGLSRVGGLKEIERALPLFASVAEKALEDPRFSPINGRQDPSALLARLQNALAALKKRRDALTPPAR